MFLVIGCGICVGAVLGCAKGVDVMFKTFHTYNPTINKKKGDKNEKDHGELLLEKSRELR